MTLDVRRARLYRDLAAPRRQRSTCASVLSPYDRRAGESTRADRRLSCLMTAVEFPATKERPRALCVMLLWAARRDGLAGWVWLGCASRNG